MNTVLDFGWQYFDLFLIGILITIITVIISVVFKKKITVFLVVSVVFIGAFYLIDQQRVTSFPTLASHQITEETMIRSITITAYEDPEDVRSGRSIAKIDDEDIIEQLLYDFSNIDLREDRGASSSRFYRKYNISILTTNPISEDHLKTTTFSFNLDDTHLDQYRITSETNHLKTIEALIDNEEIEWEYRE